MSFKLNLIYYPAATRVVRFWLITAGINTTASVISSVPDITDLVKKVVPAADETFLYRAVGVAIFTALPLTVFKKTLSVSIAQLGVATSIMFIGYALAPIFSHADPLIFITITLGVILVLCLLFLTGLIHYYKARSWGDLIVGATIYLLAVSAWVLPLKDMIVTELRAGS